jgi:hypothetical protein
MLFFNPPQSLMTADLIAFRLGSLLPERVQENWKVAVAVLLAKFHESILNHPISRCFMMCRIMFPLKGG